MNPQDDGLRLRLQPALRTSSRSGNGAYLGGGVISPPFFLCRPFAIFPFQNILASMEIRPIRNDDDHAAALREIEKLWGAADGTEEGDKLDILSMLVEKYEDRSWPNVDISDPIDLLNYEIDELGHSQAELDELPGSRSRASELLQSPPSSDGRDDSQDQRSVENPCRSVGEA
jgi:HTH-type transcriptional regulator/antitoxin HigA